MRMLSVMSPCAYRVTAQTMIGDAYSIMQAHGIRHLPVIDDGDVIGVLSERDIQRARMLNQGEETTAGAICTPDPHVVSTDDSVTDVVREMSIRKSDCVLIADDEDIFVGIFTTTDCCRLLCLALEEKEELRAQTQPVR